MAIWPKWPSEPILAILGTSPFVTTPRPIYQKNGLFKVIKTRESKNGGKTSFLRFLPKSGPGWPFWAPPCGHFLGATISILEQTHTRTLPSGVKKIARQPKAYRK